MNWLWHVWVLAVTFMTDLSLCLVTVVITMQQYYTENKKYIFFLIQQTPLYFRKYFFLSFCIWATHLLIQSECSMHLCDRDRYIYLINNLLKVHLHSTALHIFVLIRAVNQHWELFRSDLLSSVSKHKEHWVYHIGLPTSIWTNDAGKALRKR